MGRWWGAWVVYLLVCSMYHILSTSHYKRYNNPLLLEILEIENRFAGVLIGHIKISNVTMVDDLAFLTLVEMEMQYMLDCAHGFAGKNRYGIHPTKSYVLTYLSSHSGVEKITNAICGDQVQQASQTKHLGISRETGLKVNI